MIRVLQIRETPSSKSDGIDANCQGLISLFAKNDVIEMLPTVNYLRHTIPILRQYFLDADQIYKSFDESKPDVIHIHGAYSFTLYVAVRCATKRKIPIVFSPHFHPFWSLRRPLMGKIFFNVITKRVLPYINTIFTINDEDTRVFSKYHQNVVRVPHWAKFDTPNTRPEKNPRMILFVGRLNETNKGFEHLHNLPVGKYEIHCVGKGDIVSRPDIIKHTNITDEDLAKLYQRASLLVVPSRYEAFSYVTLEALANYTPVLISDRVRIADYLKDIKGVEIFKYQDYQDFVAKVESTLGKDVDANAINSLFSPTKIKEKYIAAYQNASSQMRLNQY